MIAFVGFSLPRCFMIQCDPPRAIILLRGETVRLDREYGLDWQVGKDEANKRTWFWKSRWFLSGLGADCIVF